MQLKVKDIFDNILKNAPGVVGVILIDFDGTPIYMNGRFDISPANLGSFSTVSHACMTQIGNQIGQALGIIIARYESKSIHHFELSGGFQLIILTKTKESQFGMLKIEAAKAIADFSRSISSINNDSECKF